MMFESKKKAQILTAHQKEEKDQTQKSPASRQNKFDYSAKKVPLGFRGFRT